MARNTGFDGDAITRLKVSYGRMDGDDLVQNSCSLISVDKRKSYLSSGLMTEDVFVLDDHGPYAPRMPKMHV